MPAAIRDMDLVDFIQAVRATDSYNRALNEALNKSDP